MKEEYKSNKKVLNYKNIHVKTNIQNNNVSGEKTMQGNGEERVLLPS